MTRGKASVAPREKKHAPRRGEGARCASGVVGKEASRSTMRVLLVTPPMTQLNTPYPATAYLAGFLRRHAPEVEVRQADLALGLFLRLFSQQGLTRARDHLLRRAAAAGR